MKLTNKIRSIFGVLALTCLMLALNAIPASAHVTIDPKEAPKSSYGVFSFRVPNESDTASTIKIEVQFPEDHPIAYVSTTDQDGWKATVEKSAPKEELEAHGSKIDEVVKKVTWEGGKIEPGKFAEFHVSMGALPEDADELTFKALQTYDDGEVVGWTQETIEGEEEPELPAPVLSLTEAQDDHHGSTTDSKTEVSDSTESESSDIVSYVAIGIGVLALIVALGALFRKK